MTANHDLERRLADLYATEPPLRAPDRVLENALTSIEATPQRRVLVQAPWRFRAMNSYSKVAVAAVAIVALAFAARMLLPDADIAGPPTPAPTSTSLPSPTATATPTQSAALELPAADELLEPARYFLVVPGTEIRAEFTVLESGWHGNEWYLSTRAGPAGGARSVSFWTVANVYPDACEESEDRLPDPPIGPTVDDLVAALDAQENTDQQVISRPNVGGYSSTQIVMEPSTDLPQACLNGENMQMWTGPGRREGRAIETTEPRGGLQDVMWILDVGGQRIVIVGYYDRSSPAAGDVEAIIESIEFDLP